MCFWETDDPEYVGGGVAEGDGIDLESSNIPQCS